MYLYCSSFWCAVSAILQYWNYLETQYNYTVLIYNNVLIMHLLIQQNDFAVTLFVV